MAEPKRSARAVAADGSAGRDSDVQVPGHRPRARIRPWGVAAGLVAFALVALVPSELHQVPGYGSRPAYAAAVALLMAVWWFTEALPIAWTALAPLVLYPLLGVFGAGFAGEAAGAAEPYADAYIFLFLGGMAIGAAMEQCGLHRRLALHVLRAVGTSPARLLAGIILATAGASLWLSNTATAVMMVPIAMALLAQLRAGAGGAPLTRYGAAVMLSIAYAANVGGIGTKIGTGTNSIFAGFAAEKLGRDLGFLHFMGVGLPFVVLFLPVVWLVLWRLGRRDAPARGDGREVIERELAALGRASRRERQVGAVFLAAATLWMAGDLLRPLVGAFVAREFDGFRVLPKHYEAGVAMLAGLVLLLGGALGRAGLRRIPWSTLVLLGGSFALAAGIEGSGLSLWLSENLRAVAELPPWGQVALAAGATVGLSAVASNTATINVMLQVLPRDLAVLASSALAASCDFMLPAGTPPNAIVFGSGWIRLPVMMRTGFVLDVAAVLLVTAYGTVYLRWLLG